MLTIAGSGINNYSLKELASKVKFTDYDYIVTDINFDTPENKQLIPDNVEAKFLAFKEVKQFIKDNFLANKSVIYIVTGSPLFFSATSSIIDYLKAKISDFKADSVEIIPAESSKDYLLRKLKISENEVTSLSLHGRDGVDLTRFLSSKYTFLLCDNHSVGHLSEITRYIKNELIFYLGSKLGSDEETIKTVNLDEINAKNSSPFVLLIEKKFESKPVISANQDFETNAGMITKMDKRMISLQALELEPNLLMWDIGAGSGSISIDAYKLFKINTILFEKNQLQCDFIRKNLAKHKIAAAKLIEGDVLENCLNQPEPDRIFIGGGGEAVLTKLEMLYEKLNDKGILAANIIGLENLSAALQALKNANLNYEIRDIDITYYKNISKNIKLKIPEPERGLFQLILRK